MRTNRLCVLLVIASYCLTARAEEPGQGRPRFVDHGPFIEDTTTQLLWQKDGATAGKRNYYEALEYAKKLRLGGIGGWRVPTAQELEEIFPAEQEPFLNSKYTPDNCCGGDKEFANFWTCELDNRSEDYAYAYQCWGKGGANNCYASKNFCYVRCVRKRSDLDLAALANPPPLEPKLVAKVRGLIRQLGDARFSRRESATRELIALRKQNLEIEQLMSEERKKSTDFEVRTRLQMVLDAAVE